MGIENLVFLIHFVIIKKRRRNYVTDQVDRIVRD